MFQLFLVGKYASQIPQMTIMGPLNVLFFRQILAVSNFFEDKGSFLINFGEKVESGGERHLMASRVYFKHCQNNINISRQQNKYIIKKQLVPFLLFLSYRPNSPPTYQLLLSNHINPPQERRSSKGFLRCICLEQCWFKMGSKLRQGNYLCMGVDGEGIINYHQHMYNKEFLKYERLKTELETIKNFCPEQYFAVNKCSGKCGKSHVDRCYYPCIHFYMGNCKYGFNCLFSHSIKRQIVKPEPAKEICKKLYFENYCPLGNRCKFSHDLRSQPCIYNSLGKCKFSDGQCRFSHEKKVDVSIPCFFNLMAGCKNQNCENKHSNDNIIKYISYEGPI